MPIAHISMRAGKPEGYRQAIFDGIYRSMRETLSVPEDDQFMTITEHDTMNFRYGNAYGIARSADVLYIQSLCSTRAPLSRRKRCSVGLQNCLPKTPAFGQRTCL